MLLAVERFEAYNPIYTSEVIQANYRDYDLFPAKLGFFDAFYEAGRSWHNAVLPESSKNYQHSSIPTLITANQFDPVTPPKNGAIFLEKLSNAQLFILKEGGHGGSNPCSQKLMIAFMDNPYGDLDTSCLNIYRKEN